MDETEAQRTLRVRLEFDGSGFEGWQRQPEGRTVQGELEAALHRILGAPHRVVGAGRTDAGVHALQMIASFRTGHTMPAPDLTRALALASHVVGERPGPRILVITDGALDPAGVTALTSCTEAPI